MVYLEGAQPKGLPIPPTLRELAYFIATNCMSASSVHTQLNDPTNPCHIVDQGDTLITVEFEDGRQFKGPKAGPGEFKTNALIGLCAMLLPPRDADPKDFKGAAQVIGHFWSRIGED